MGDIMTGVAKKWDVENSLTCKRKLVQIAREITWKRKNNMSNKYTEKGVSVEQESVTLYSMVKGINFVTNSERLTNDFFTGEVDIYRGQALAQADHIIDIKSCWNWTTFPSLLDEVDKDYFYQGQTYMALTGAKVHTVAYCLVNTPAQLIYDEKQRLRYKMGVLDTEPQEFIDKCIEIEKTHIVDMESFRKSYGDVELYIKDWSFDIPKEERVIEFDIVRDENVIRAMQDRACEANDWLFKYFPKLKEYVSKEEKTA